MTTPSWELHFAPGVSGVPREQWDLCAGEVNPFVGHDFLSALEDSGCVGRSTGWIPYPALLRRRGTDELIACAPLYIKLHSRGEYIFDYQWAHAYHSAPHRPPEYYPKLQVAVPFTPVPGPRLLVRPDLSEAERLEARRALLQGLLQAAEQLDFSSVHLTYCGPEEVEAARGLPQYQLRLDEQYHWFRDGDGSFDAFLDRLTSRRRKTIRRERRKVAAHPLRIETVTGDQATEAQWDALYEMYRKTCLEKWGAPYLNRAFFRNLAERMGPKVVLFLVSANDGRPVASAWNVQGSEALFGRNWGCIEEFDLLHFEVCYYRPIDYALEHRLERVEAGAQGMHKIPRGYRPVPVYSLHSLRDPNFSALLRDHLAEERREMTLRFEELTEALPFSRNADLKGRKP